MTRPGRLGLRLMISLRLRPLTSDSSLPPGCTLTVTLADRRRDTRLGTAGYESHSVTGGHWPGHGHRDGHGLGHESLAP